MMNISEEAGINGAMQLCTEATHSLSRYTNWMIRSTGSIARTTVGIVKSVNAKKSKEISNLVSDACSAYRGGFIKSKDSEPLKDLINDLRGTEMARADGNFFFLGNKSDLSYFWKKTDEKNNVILLREYIDSISDSFIRKGTLSAMTQAQVDGVVSFDGKAYALTEKGKSYVYDPSFIAGRLDAEEKFLKRASERLGGEIEGINKGEKMFILDNGTNGHEYTVTGGELVEGKAHVSFFSDTEGELWLPKEAIGEVAFPDKISAQKYVNSNSEKIADWQRIINAQREATVEHFTKGIQETEGGFLVDVGDTNKYERLEIPKADAKLLEDGSLKADIYSDKLYTVYTGKNTYQVDGTGAKDLLGEGIKKTVENTRKAVEKAVKTTQEGIQKTGEAVKKTADAVKKTADAAIKMAEIGATATVETVTTAFPPAKAVSLSVNIINTAANIAGDAIKKTGEVAKKATETTVQSSQKISETSLKL